jgi:hypothetical protein
MTGRMTYKRALLWLIDHDDPTEIDPAAIRLSNAVALAEMIYGYTHNIPETIARLGARSTPAIPPFVSPSIGEPADAVAGATLRCAERARR